MSERVLEKLERVAEISDKFAKAMEKIPRVLGMFGVAMFAGKASKRLGGDFTTGAIGGAVAHDLAHSQLPNNQIGGVALGAYFTAIGLMNIIPELGLGGIPNIFDVDPSDLSIFDIKLESDEQSMPRDRCLEQGGIVQSVILRASGLLGPFGPNDMVVCKLPQPTSVPEGIITDPGVIVAAGGSPGSVRKGIIEDPGGPSPGPP